MNIQNPNCVIAKKFKYLNWRGFSYRKRRMSLREFGEGPGPELLLVFDETLRIVGDGYCLLTLADLMEFPQTVQ